MLKNKKRLILAIILIIIVITGIAVSVVKGMKYSVNYDNSVSLQVYIDADVEMKDIKNISKEVLKNKEVILANTNKSSKEILITVKEANEEELKLLAEKINEKYGTSITLPDIEIINNYKINFIDIVKPYILPTVICLAVILVYFGILYRKNKVLQILIYTIIIPIIAELLYFSLLVLTRFPISILTMPISMLIFIVSILILAYIFSKKYTNKGKKTAKK